MKKIIKFILILLISSNTSLSQNNTKNIEKQFELNKIYRFTSGSEDCNYEINFKKIDNSQVKGNFNQFCYEEGMGWGNKGFIGYIKNNILYGEIENLESFEFIFGKNNKYFLTKTTLDNGEVKVHKKENPLFFNEINDSGKLTIHELFNELFEKCANKKAIKDKFETTENYQNRIKNIKPIIDSIIYLRFNRFLNYYDDESSLGGMETLDNDYERETKLINKNYSADLSELTFEFIFEKTIRIIDLHTERLENEDYLVNEIFGDILVFDSNAGVMKTKIYEHLTKNTYFNKIKLNISPNIAKEIFDKIEFTDLTITKYKLVDGFYIPVNGYLNIKGNKYYFEDKNEQTQDIIFKFKINQDIDYEFNYNEYQNELLRVREEKIKKELEIRREVELEKIRIEEEKKQKKLEELKREEKKKFYSTTLGKRALVLKNEIIKYLSDKKFTSEEITDKFNILKDSILNEEIEINRQIVASNDIRENYFCNINNYNSSTEELKLEFYSLDSYFNKISNYITLNWKKENFEQIQKQINKNNSSPFLLAPITVKLVGGEFRTNQFALLLQPFKRSNIIDIYNESYTKQFTIELKKNEDRYLLKCVNRNILEYFSVNDIEEPVVLYDFNKESKNFSKLPKKLLLLYSQMI